MRRRFLILAAVVLPSAAALAVSAYGCSGPQPFESACLWLGDPNNCYRDFREDMKANAVSTSPDNPFGDCTPGGSPTEASPAAAGTPNGSFAVRTKLDTCVFNNGGQVTIDPPLDLGMWPPNAYAAPVTYTFTFQTADSNTCGKATYTSPHGFSITIDPLPDGGIAGLGGGATTTTTTATATTTGDGGRVPMPYGTFTSVIAPGSDAFDVTCPSGESHHFNINEVEGLPGEDGGSCPGFADFLPSASFQVFPGGVNKAGAVSFAIVYPPIPPASYPADAAAPPVANPPTVYFNCSIPGGSEQCVDGAKDGAETDVDCGGPQNPTADLCGSCPVRCESGQMCLCDADCDQSQGLVCAVSAQGTKQCVVLDAGVVSHPQCSWNDKAPPPCTPDGGTGGGDAGTGGGDAGASDASTD